MRGRSSRSLLDVVAFTAIACAINIPQHGHPTGLPEQFLDMAERGCTWEAERWPSPHTGVDGVYAPCMAGLGFIRRGVGGFSVFHPAPEAPVPTDLAQCADLSLARQRKFDACARAAGIRHDAQSSCRHRFTATPPDCKVSDLAQQRCADSSGAFRFEQPVLRCLGQRGWRIDFFPLDRLDTPSGRP